MGGAPQTTPSRKTANRGGMELESENEFDSSSDLDSDLPVFEDYKPSTPHPTHKSPQPRLSLISQGLPPNNMPITTPTERSRVASLSPTEASPTLVTPLSQTAGLSVTGGFSPEPLTPTREEEGKRRREGRGREGKGEGVVHYGLGEVLLFWR